MGRRALEPMDDRSLSLSIERDDLLVLGADDCRELGPTSLATRTWATRSNRYAVPGDRVDELPDWIGTADRGGRGVRSTGMRRVAGVLLAALPVRGRMIVFAFLAGLTVGANLRFC